VKCASFQKDTRTFLEVLNDSLATQRKVFSFPYAKLCLNNVRMGSDWIDFGEESITFWLHSSFCSTPQLFDGRGPVLVRIPYNRIQETLAAAPCLLLKIECTLELVDEIPPPGNHNTIEIEFVSPNDFIFVQQSILQPVFKLKGMLHRLKAKRKASRATIAQLPCALYMPPNSCDSREAFFTSQPLLSQCSINELCTPLKHGENHTNVTKGKRAQPELKDSSHLPSVGEERAHSQTKRAKSTNSNKPALSSPALSSSVDRMTPHNQDGKYLELLQSLQHLLSEKISKKTQNHIQLSERMSEIDHHLTTLWNQDTERDALLKQHEKELEILEKQCIDTIRAMKKEQAAYNAKMDSKIHSQLDAWITLREHMSNLSLQLKEIGVVQRSEKKELRALLRHNRAIGGKGVV
jgi:hypothetical protein